MQERVFSSLGAFAVFLRGSTVRELAGDVAGRAGVAHLLAESARKKIGHAELLPPPLTESTQAERVKAGFSADETLLRTGALQDSIAWDHAGKRETMVGSTDPKAVYHEFGGSTPGRPPKRSFLASTAADRNDQAFALYLKLFTDVFTR